jgi:group I intron endonuclease
MFTNKKTKDFYIGQSKNLANRFKSYYSTSHLKRTKIGRFILEYGHSHFSLTIKEYCDISALTSREQYYFDKLNPTYNVLKKAGSYGGGVNSKLRKKAGSSKKY